MYVKYLKRLLDFILAIIMIILLLPVLLVASLLILILDGGPVIFKQKRIGLKGKSFYIYKLKTMKRDKDGINQITKIGNVLRVTSIDELPQLINILKGQMSFIGPRPWIEEYTKYFNKKDRRRSEVLPGLSGWAQVQGRNGITIKEKLDADVWYVDNISLKVDVTILFKTIVLILKKTSASITEAQIQDELSELKEKNAQELQEENTFEQQEVV